jgi:hypothetical protein
LSMSSSSSAQIIPKLATALPVSCCMSMHQQLSPWCSNALASLRCGLHAYSGSIAPLLSSSHICAWCGARQCQAYSIPFLACTCLKRVLPTSAVSAMQVCKPSFCSTCGYTCEADIADGACPYNPCSR